MDLHLHRAKIYPLLVSLIRRVFIIALALFVLLLIGWPLVQKWLHFFSADGTPSSTREISVLENVMNAPRFASQTNKGDPYEIKALQAKGTLSGVVSLVQPKATLLKGNEVLKLTANQGQFQEKKGLLSLQNNVQLRDNLGYHLKTEQVDMDLKTKQLQGNKAVQAVGPAGVGRADGFTFKQLEDNHILILKGHPRLVIQPTAKHR